MINWWMALVGGAISLVLMVLVGKIGGLQWWRRRPWYLQLILMIVIPVLAISVVLAILLLLNRYSLDDAAGLVVGTTLATMGPLFITSYLIEQIRVAFADESDDDESSA